MATQLYRNHTDSELQFRINTRWYHVWPGEVVEIPCEFAYVVEAPGYPLTPYILSENLDEVDTLPLHSASESNQDSPVDIIQKSKRKSKAKK